jgi:hypothetical protein
MSLRNVPVPTAMPATPHCSGLHGYPQGDLFESNPSRLATAAIYTNELILIPSTYSGISSLLYISDDTTHTLASIFCLLCFTSFLSFRLDNPDATLMALYNFRSLDFVFSARSFW